MSLYVDNIEQWLPDADTNLQKLVTLWEAPYYDYLSLQLRHRETDVLQTDWFRTQARAYNWYPLLDILGVAHDDKILFDLIVQTTLTPTLPNLYTLTLALFGDAQEIEFEILAPHKIKIKIKPPVDEFSTPVWATQGFQIVTQQGDDLYARTPLDEGFYHRWSTYQFYVSMVASHAGLHIEYYIIP